VPLAGNFERPISITHAGDGTGRIFIVEKTGAIRIVDGLGNLLPAPFLELGSQVSTGSEQGVLGLAFHPEYAATGLFFVHYTNTGGDTVVSRFSVSADSNVADPTSEVQILTVVQPYANHNGGQIAFGPDGYLYIGLGDGGAGGDPGDRAQDKALLLGKILRIDVDGQDPGLQYAIPPDNPFVGVPGVREEIWAVGLRNPWRFSFDRLTGDLFMGDVGQYEWEEINVQPASSSGGENWGWRCYEGNVPFNTDDCLPVANYFFPILVYQHAAGNCSVNGGYRYRGPNYPNLHGRYLFGDYCSGRIWAGAFDGASWSADEVFDMTSYQSTFGEDEDGELLVASYSDNATVYRIVDSSLVAEVFSDGFEDGHTDAWDAISP
jgi:glucose/arabinose dehydrogenase